MTYDDITFLASLMNPICKVKSCHCSRGKCIFNKRPHGSIWIFWTIYQTLKSREAISGVFCWTTSKCRRLRYYDGRHATMRTLGCGLREVALRQVSLKQLSYDLRDRSGMIPEVLSDSDERFLPYYYIDSWLMESYVKCMVNAC